MEAKIKEVHEIKPWSGPNGTTYYHNLLMDNGDRINIGKKKEQKVGWELSYEIIGDKKEDGSFQQEYPKAKSIQKENGFQKQSNGSKGGQASFALSYSKDLAVAGKIQLEEVTKYATEFNEWLKQNS